MSEATAVAATGGQGAGRRGLRGNPGLTLISVALGVMMVALDGTIVAVANPSIQAHLHASLSGDIAGNLGLIIAFRVLLGIFGAMLQPTALALLRNTFPAHRLNSAIGIWGAVLGASTAAGPIVGGLLVQHINWEACFYVNVPVGIIALVVGTLVLKETPPSPVRSFDFPGIALLSVALFALVWGLIKGSSYGWGSGKTIAFFAGAAAAMALFSWREQRTSE